MAMVVSALADAIKNALGQGAQPTSPETTGMAQSIIDELKACVVSHALVTGVAAAPGSPLQSGAAVGGLIVGLVGSSLAGRFKDNMGKPSITPELLGMANGMVTKLLAATVSFAPGGITGTCTHTAESPGPLVGGVGQNGVLVGVDGGGMATLIAVNMGKGAPTPELTAMCNAIASYLMGNAVASYASGAVTGTCPSGGGPLAAGLAAGGTIQ